MPPNTFEKYLPYAMALGVESHWAQAFAGIIKDPPNWYVSPNGTAFNPHLSFPAACTACRTTCSRSSFLSPCQFERFRVERRRWWWIFWRRFRSGGEALSEHENRAMLS